MRNGQYSRAILFKIFDLLDGHSVLNSQVSMRHEIVDYNDFKNMNQLLEVSLGDDIMNKYLVNREPDVFHNISRLISYLHTDFYHIMEDYTLVFSGGHNTLVSDLLLYQISSGGLRYFDLAAIKRGGVLVDGSNRYVFDPSKTKLEFIHSAYEIMKNNDNIKAFVINYTDNSQNIIDYIVWKGDITNAYDKTELTTTGQQLFAIDNLDILTEKIGRESKLFIDLNLKPDSEIPTLISSLLENTSHKLIDVSSTSTDSFYGSMNAGMKAIVDSLNELSQEEDAMSDFRNLINEDSNGVGSSLGNMKLTLIKKLLVPLLQELGYLKDAYYGLPVLINKEIV